MTKTPKCVIISAFQNKHSEPIMVDFYDLLDNLKIKNDLDDVVWLDKRKLNSYSFPNIEWHDLPVSQMPAATSVQHLFENSGTIGEISVDAHIEWAATTVICNSISYPNGTAALQLTEFFKNVGQRPASIIFRYTGSDLRRYTETLGWEKLETLADEYAAKFRFNRLYDFNFKCLATKAIRHCIQNHSRNYAQERHLKASENCFIMFLFFRCCICLGISKDARL